jgi:hypothetical protein
MDHSVNYTDKVQSTPIRKYYIQMWKDKIVLNSNEVLKHESSKTSGFMQEEDIDFYSIHQKDGTKIGSVKVTDHTAVKGFKRTITVHQTDITGKTVVDARFTPS